MNIKKASEICETTIDTIRYYEKVGVIPAIKRNDKGIRIFDDEDIRWILFVKQMRNAGLPIKTLSLYMELFQQGDETISQRKDLLKEQISKTENKMKQMEEALERLRFKFDNYDIHTYKAEQKLKK